MKHIELVIKCIRNNKRETYQAMAIQLTKTFCNFESNTSHQTSHIIFV